MTIQNCFRYGGFVKTEEEEEEEDDRSIETWEDLNDKTWGLDGYRQWSSNLSIYHRWSQNVRVSDESDEEVDIVVKPFSNKEVLDALDMLRRVVHHQGTNFNIQYENERYTSRILIKNKKQTKITNFFHK